MIKKVNRLIISSLICVLIGICFTPTSPVSSKSNIHLSRTKYTYDSYGRHLWDKIALKGVPSNAKITWKSSSSSVIRIADKTKNGTWYRILKPGKATISATYKGKKYSCRIVVKKKETTTVTPNPTAKPPSDDNDGDNSPDSTLPKTAHLNVTDVTIYYCKDYAIPYAHDPSHPTQFQFKLEGVDADPIWSVTLDDPDTFGGLSISKDGLLTISSRGCPDTTATVTARYFDDVLTCKVTVIDETRIKYEEKVNAFFDNYISPDMTDLDKVEAVARYIEHEMDYELYQPDWQKMLITSSGDCMASRIGVSELCKRMGFKTYIIGGERLHGRTMVRIGDDIYMTVTGFREARPRTYWVYKINDEELSSLSKEFPACKYYLGIA